MNFYEFYVLPIVTTVNYDTSLLSKVTNLRNHNFLCHFSITPLSLQKVYGPETKS